MYYFSRCDGEVIKSGQKKQKKNINLNLQKVAFNTKAFFMLLSFPSSTVLLVLEFKKMNDTFSKHVSTVLLPSLVLNNTKLNLSV